jgi:ABC-type nitrate/sulfonate/bicarbonate transport system substrate-binding protein
MRKNNFVRIILLSTLLSSLLVSCAPAATQAPQALSMTFMAGYKPQANLPFVGVYVAQEKGFFQDENLTVSIEHSPGSGQHLQLVATGKVQVTTQDAGVMLQRRADPGLPLVSIALIGQRGQQAFAALADKGLKTPKDWEGRTVGYKGTPPPDLKALLIAAGADPGKVQLVNVGFDPRLLTEGKVDVYPVFKSNEPFLIRSWGYELTLWDAADYGVPSLGLAYVTSEETLAQQPEVLRRFLRAALRGIEYASQNREEAVTIVLKYTGPETDAQHMRFMLDAELLDAENDLTAEHGVGWQEQSQWQDLAEMLQQNEVLSEIDVSKAFTVDLLKE